MAARWFEDWVPGERFETAARLVTDDDVDRFVALTGDANPLHTDAAWARAHSPFGGRVAHGPLVLSLALGLISRLGLGAGTVQASLGLADWRFREAVRPGDHIVVRLEVQATRPASGGDRGVVSMAVEVVNQHGAVVQSGSYVMLVAMRPRA